MKYNFINHKNKQLLFKMEGDFNTMLEGNSVKIKDIIYIIERIENVLKIVEDTCSYVKLEEVNVYIKDREDYYYD